MTLFGLVRHGQTDFNRRNLFQGSSDVPLNDTGRDQAHHALGTAPRIPWDAVVTSPLLRAQETGRLISADHAVPFGGTDPRLVEIDWGAAEGHDVQEMEARYPGRSFPGREDMRSVIDRATAAIADLAVARPRESVLVVAHGTLIRLVLSAVTGVHLPSIPNGTLSLLQVEDESWTVKMIAGVESEDPASVSSPARGPRVELAGHHLRPQGLTAPRR